MRDAFLFGGGRPMGFFAYALNDKCGCGLFGVLLFWIFADALRIVHGGGVLFRIALSLSLLAMTGEKAHAQ